MADLSDDEYVEDLLGLSWQKPGRDARRAAVSAAEAQEFLDDLLDLSWRRPKIEISCSSTAPKIKA